MRTTLSIFSTVVLQFLLNQPGWASANPVPNIPKLQPSSDLVTNQIAYPPEVLEVMQRYGVSPNRDPKQTNQSVKVVVDKSTQTMTIVAPDFEAPLTMAVSTGGGLKFPDRSVNKNAWPFCASTTKVKDLFIPASKYKPVHYSSRFVDDQGNNIPMPHAWHVVNGDFFHEVPPAYINKISENVSAGCIRLHSIAARLLSGLSLKYGGFRATIENDDPDEGPKCTPELKAKARKCIEEKENPGWLSIFGFDNSEECARILPSKNRARKPRRQESEPQFERHSSEPRVKTSQEPFNPFGNQ